jgi:hypothetical protein
MSLLDNLELIEAVDDETWKQYAISAEERLNAIKYAERAGHTIIRSEPDLLLLDLDVPYDDKKPVLDDEVEEILSRYAVLGGRARWKSRGGNTHMTIRLAKPLPALARIALQAALGSDPKKEAISVLRLLNGVEEPLCSLLFKPGGTK